MQKYEPLSTEEYPGSPPSSQLRFSQTREPVYELSHDPRSNLNEYSQTPLGNFNDQTFDHSDDGIVPIKSRLWRHSRRSRLIFCILGMGFLGLLAFILVTAVGLGLAYDCSNPSYQKTRSFSTPFSRTTSLRINAINAFVEFDTSDDSASRDIVILVKTGARTQSEFELMTVNFEKGNGTYALNIGGNPNLNLDAFMERCLLTSVKVLFPTKRFFNGELSVQIKNGEIEMEDVAGWSNGNFTISRGRIEMEDINGAINTNMAVGKGHIKMKNFKSKNLDITLDSVETSAEVLGTDKLNLRVNGESEVSLKSVNLFNTTSTLRISGDGRKASVKLAGLSQGNTFISLPNGKASVGVSTSFCGPFDLTAGEFEFKGDGISVDSSSTATHQVGKLGVCTKGSLTSVSKGKFKLIVK